MIKDGTRAVSMDYTTLSLAKYARLDDLAREARATFGALDALQLNWASAAQWSVDSASSISSR